MGPWARLGKSAVEVVCAAIDADPLETTTIEDELVERVEVDIGCSMLEVLGDIEVVGVTLTDVVEVEATTDEEVTRLEVLEDIDVVDVVLENLVEDE